MKNNNLILEFGNDNLILTNNKATSASGQLGITKAISGEANKKSTTNVASSEAVIASTKIK